MSDTITAPPATPPPANSTPPATPPVTSPPPTPQTPPAGTQPTTTGHLGSFIDDKGTFKPGWTKSYEGLPDTLEKKFTSPESLLKSYVNLERMLGNPNKVAVPSEHATKEEWAEFYNKIGRPEKPEGYEIKMPEKIGDKPFPKELWSEEKATKFAQWAHEKGLTKSQVQALIEYDATRGMTDQESVTAAQQKTVADAQTALKAEWGPNYAANLELAKKGAEQAGGAELMAHPLANDPTFIKAMAKVGRMIGESPAAGARGTQHAISDPKSEIARIMADKSHPYHPKHPDPVAHQRAVEHVANLYKQAYPEPART